MAEISKLNGVDCANITAFNGVTAANISKINGVDMCSDDVTPDSVNWGNVSGGDEIGTWTYTTQQITGIDVTITLDPEITGVTGTGGVYYYKIDNSSPSFNSSLSPASQGFSTYNDATTFDVSNNQYVSFAVDCSTTGNGNSTTTVYNNSDGAASLDTFTNTWACR